MSENTKTKKPFNWKALVAILSIFVLLIGGWILTVGLKGWNFGQGTSFYVKDVILNNILGVNAILIGLLVLAGYLILGRGISDSILGMIKAMIGVLILSIGAGTLVGIAKPVFNAFKNFGNVKPLDPYFGWTSAQNFLSGIQNSYVAWISYSLLIGFFINIVLISLRRWTNVHSLMITGHVMFQQSAIVTTTVFFTMFGGVGFWSNNLPTIGAQVGVIIISGVILGAYWGVASTATIKGSDIVTQNAGFAVGHQQMIGLSIAYGIGKYFGKKEDSAETKKLSNKVKLFEDNIFTQSVIILVLFFILIMVLQFAPLPAGAKADAVRFTLDNNVVNKGVYGTWTAGGAGAFWLIQLALGSLKLVGSILVLQMGVRMFVTELQQSFQGISEKLIPGAVVAVDVAATYGFSPNSVTYGFVAGTIAQFAAMGIVIGLSFIPFGNQFKLIIPIPLFITLFFNSGSIGVFANASGGYKATLIVPAIFGAAGILISAFGMSMLTSFGGAATFDSTANTIKYANFKTTPFASGYIGMFDWNVVWGLLMIIGSWNPYVAFVVFPVYVVLLMIGAQIVDSNRQKSATLLQKAFKIKPNLVFEKELEEVQAS